VCDDELKLSHVLHLKREWEREQGQGGGFHKSLSKEVQNSHFPFSLAVHVSQQVQQYLRTIKFE